MPNEFIYIYIEYQYHSNINIQWINVLKMAMSGAYVFHTPISLWKYFVTLFRNLDRISPQLIFLLIRQVYLSVDLSSFGLKVQDVCWAGDLIRNVL